MLGLRRSLVIRYVRSKGTTFQSVQSHTPAATNAWSPAGELGHTYAVKEFERQVFSRMVTCGEFARQSEYTILGEATLKAYHDFRQEFLTSNSGIKEPEGFKWKTEKVEKSTKQRAHEAGQTYKFECDMYIKMLTTTQVSELLKNCYSEVMALNPAAKSTEWKQLSLSAGDVMLLEVAETPESMKAKIWQLIRAMSFGPEGFRSPKVCVVCLNGEPLKFEAAARAVRDGLNESMFPAVVPLFGLWTPYRNVYKEIVDMKTDMAGMKTDIAKLDAGMAGMKTAMAGMKTDIAKLDAKLDAGMAKLDAKLEKIEAGRKSDRSDMKSDMATLGEKLDALLQQRSR